MSFSCPSFCPSLLPFAFFFSSVLLSFSPSFLPSFSPSLFLSCLLFCPFSFPPQAILYFFGYSDPYDDLAAFDDVCGLNFSAVKPLALLEPIVDFMNPRQVVTAPAPVLTLDLATAPVGSTKALTLDISLKLTSSVYPTGIGAYFEVGFTEATPPVGFSTAPNASATHWKQTLFPLHKQKGRGAVEAEGEGKEEGKGEGWKKGDLVKGEMRVKENERNRRDLDIELDCGGESYEFKLR